jgi:hypothetical protein
MSNKLLATLAIAVVAIASLISINVEGAGAAPDTPQGVEQPASVERPVHWGVTAPAYDVCAWTGVRDGVLGLGGANVLTEYYNFWYVDHYWVFCSARLTWSGDFHCWIVSRHDGYTLHLGAC